MAVRVARRGARAEGDDALRSAEAEELLLGVVQQHAEELLRVALRHSRCLEDAQDAYQRSLEQFVRHAGRLERERAHRWLFTVCKREARAIRAGRQEHAGPLELDPERVEARHDPSPEERALEAEALARSAEALRTLKPQEVRALWLRADGRSYAEIQALTGWTYTKVNRNLREGRAAFLRRCAELETGAGCAERREALAALAAGGATGTDLAALRSHLRGCTACRATLRSLHASSAGMAGVLPPGVLGAAASGPGTGVDALGSWLVRVWEAVAGPVQERAAAGALQWQAALEATASGKVAAVAASTVALAGGGAVAVHEVAPERQRTARAAVGEGGADAGRAGAGARGAPGRAAVSGHGTGSRAVTVRPAMSGPRGVVSDAPGTRTPAPEARVAAPGTREFGVAPPAREGPARAEFGGTGRAPRAPAARGVPSPAGSRPAALRSARAARTPTSRRAGPAATAMAPAGTEFAPARPAPAPPGAATVPRSPAPPGTSAPQAEFGP